MPLAPSALPDAAKHSIVKQPFNPLKCHEQILAKTHTFALLLLPHSHSLHSIFCDNSSFTFLGRIGLILSASHLHFCVPSEDVHDRGWLHSSWDIGIPLNTVSSLAFIKILKE